jgi:putative endonuclease
MPHFTSKKKKIQEGDSQPLVFLPDVKPSSLRQLLRPILFPVQFIIRNHGISCPALRGKTANMDTDVQEKAINTFHCINSGKHISLKGEMEGLNNQSRWRVYVLSCRNNYLYIGITNNLQKRMAAHEKGNGSKFVRSHRPFELLKVIYCIDEKEARKLEYSLKKLKRRDKFKKLGLEYCAVPGKLLLS